MEKVKTAVLGTGTIIRDFHLLTLLHHPQVEVVAVANMRQASLDKLAAEFNIPRTYSNFSDLAADAEVQAVINGLPNYLHAPVSIEMLEGGKHVMCEKPMAMSVSEGEQMIQASQRANRKLMIAHNWRFERELIWLRDVIAEGTLGKIVKAKSFAMLLTPLGEGAGTDSWFVKRKYAGGGALADMGIHSIDTLRFVLGNARPLSVLASIGTHFSNIELEDTATLMVNFENDITAFIEAGWYHLYADGGEAHTHVYGTKGYAKALPSELHTYVEGTWSVTRPPMPERRIWCDLPMYQAQTDHFIDCIINDKHPSPDGGEGLWAMRLLEAAYRSGETGELVRVSE